MNDDAHNPRIVLLAGATSPSGRAIASTLVAHGIHVVAVGRSRERLESLAQTVGPIETAECDLAEQRAVQELAAHIRSRHGRLDGLIHLVGGWRSGTDIDNQSDDDWAFLEASLTALRRLSRAFYRELLDSSAGRLAIVSSPLAVAPKAGTANYAALKAAAEAWTLAVADGFAAAGTSAAASILVTRAGLTGNEQKLADRVLALWDAPAEDLNGLRLPID